LRLPERIETARLVLRRPLQSDADAVFLGWASDDVATRFMSWPRHRTLDDSRAFMDYSDVEWDRWSAGPYLMELRSSGDLVGSCGFAFRDWGMAEVGYILARHAWGLGYATESLAAQVDLAAPLGPITLEASVHPDNHASSRVLEKCSFERDRSSRATAPFPNLADCGQVVAARWVRVLGAPAAAQQRHRADGVR
jgi:[ribosomal protein S5]-alanine N-acetyltransferase